MKLNPKHWSNNAAGLFLVAVVFFVVTLAINRSFPSGATTAMLWLFALIGVAALGAWIGLSYLVATQSGSRSALDYRRPQV